MVNLLDLVTIVSIGLLIGTELSVSVFINPILYMLDDRSQANAIRLFAKRLGTAMPFWYATSLALLIASATLHRHEAGCLMMIVASVIWAGVIIYTLLVLVPINNRMMELNSEAFPAEARREHGKWDSLHRLRVLALSTAMVCFLVAIHV
jgi:uncharacterized membrane protein